MRSIKNISERIRNNIYGKHIVKNKETWITIDGERIRHLFFPAESDTLIIGFQAVPVKEGEHKYNYVATLSDVKANRLYIQDDFTSFGNYYLGGNGTFKTEEAVFSLIDLMIKRCGAKHLIFVGSSKGGYAAINFGIMYKNSVMIVAAPQYYLGDYMWDTKKLRDTALEDVAGAPVTEDKIRYLNERLKGKIEWNPYPKTQKVFIHCSVNEKTYERHVKDMIRDMKESGIDVHFDRGWYEKHEDLRLYFPDYLRKTANQIVRRSEEQERRDG